MEYGCGGCGACRINRSRLWVARMMLEALEHPYASFVTLTYDEEHVPVSVEKREVQLFLKRLRKELDPREIRYYAVGEYGDRSWRPHYHLILFNVSPTEEEVLKKCWNRGLIHVGMAEPASMAYCCGYITKKMTKPKDRRLLGRKPEFCLMSLKPGLGTGVVERIKQAYQTRSGMYATTELKSIRIQGKKYPLGRYLRDKALDAIGVGTDRKKFRSILATLEKYDEKSVYTTIGYESERAARVAQQNTIQKVRSL